MSGTNELAHALATALGCPALCRDEIKGGLVHTCGPTFEGAGGDELNRPTHELFFEVLKVLLAGGASVVAAASYQDRLWRSGLEPLSELAELRIVQCSTDPGLARERRRAAIESGGHRAHAVIIGEKLEDWEQAFASFERLSLPAPTIGVVTDDGYSPGLAEIVEFVSRS